jgi:RNA polymerase sigma-70 factor (ECF subfamily)
MSEERARDASLVARLRAGDARALEELYHRHVAACTATARRVVLNPHVAEEVVQDVFLRLWKAPDRYDEARGSLRSFLLASAQNGAIDVVRADRTRRVRDERHGRAQTHAIDTVEEALRRRDSEAVRRAVLQLNDNERAAVVLAYYGGYSYRDVAQVLHLPEGTVKTRIRNGLRRMQHVLRAETIAA